MKYIVLMIGFLIGALFGLIIGICLSDAEDDVITERMMRDDPDCIPFVLDFKHRKRG